MNLLDHTPQFTVEEAASIALQHFSIQTTACRQLDSERDQNFLVTGDDQQQFVLKIANRTEQRALLEGQNAMMSHVAQRVDFTPQVINGHDGESIATVAQNGQPHLVRLVSYLPGKSMADCNYLSPRLLDDIGRRVAELDVALADFEYPAFHRDFHWDLAKAESVIQERLSLIEDAESRGQVGLLLNRYSQHTVPVLDELPRGIIHNDANDGNIVVTVDDDLFETRITGLVDFGDAVYSWTIGDLAVAIAYAILKTREPWVAMKRIVRSYHAVRPLSEVEATALYGMTCMRLCMSTAIAAEQTQSCPDNEYLIVSQAAIRKILPKLATTSFEFGEAFFRSALGWPATRNFDAVLNWFGTERSFAFPVNPEQTGQRPPSDRTLVLDLGVESPLLPVDIDSISEPALTEIIFEQRRKHNAAVVIGRYLEPRMLYSSGHFTGNDLADENRTIHLGIDIFAEAGTNVIAPMDGTVYYAGIIDKPLDYGGLVILRHINHLSDFFYTLYGHLDPESIANLKPDRQVLHGQAFAKLGKPEVNGGWTPHVHFQMMLDLLGLEHEFPGVAYASQIEAWASVSPDPNLILGIDSSCFPKPSPSKAETLAERKERVGPSLSIGYRAPLKIVRGWKQYLFDETGRRYLDAYNNVPHVGHSHPLVVESVYQQMRLLNTNTRYLHDNINQLAERLTATMPPGLDVCYFVNSASEANELALRLAREFTGARDLIVLEAAYHGHSTTLIDISPYKHDGPGGSGAPDWVHTVPLPDVFRGRYQDVSTAAADYAHEVAQRISRIDRKLCGFVCESCPSVGGQIMLPNGYLSQVYQSVRGAGGVCIADDVQTGYGRLGSHMYGFEMQDVVPDIVVLGKPIGNGHPLAAVVTTRLIAESFDNGMEFFSTFGGNPVSCAAGLAVLDVLHRESLQANALQVGDVLLHGLRELQRDHSVIGDVRGRGFFLGVELVKDQQSKQPAAGEANFISNICRDLGLLIGTDGPDHNVLKIRPPMCFSGENATELLVQMRRAFEMR